MSQNSEIPASKVGHQWRFNQEEIDVWMKSQRPDRGSPKQTDKPPISGDEKA